MTGSSQPSRPAAPRLEPVAETKLLMEGLAQPNLKGVDRLLKAEPADADAWRFARGQSLLIAETANLLMLRPPKGADPEATWMNRATDLREAAGKLARTIAARDYPKSRQALEGVAATCNRCHESFQVEARVQLTDPVK
jgi:hypothetical protein